MDAKKLVTDGDQILYVRREKSGAAWHVATLLHQDAAGFVAYAVTACGRLIPDYPLVEIVSPEWGWHCMACQRRRKTD